MTENNRRDFIKTAALGVAALGAAGTVVDQLTDNAEAAEQAAQAAGGKATSTSGYASKNFNMQGMKTAKKWRSSGIDGSGVPLHKLDRPLRILVFGAHPDDSELKAGGIAAKWAARGHEVLLCSVTNGNMGYWKNTGEPLAKRRKGEVEKADKILGCSTKVLDVDDTTFMPTYENRLKMIRVIRQWKADIVMGHRPYDYQADHRYCGTLLQDCAFMAAVPGVLPELEPVPNPVFLFLYDYFTRPIPFYPDIAVSIDETIGKKVDALNVMDSQFYEGGCMSNDETIPKTPEEAKKRRAKIREMLRLRSEVAADAFRDSLVKWYGKEKAAKIKHAEAFEICEYGRKISEEEIRGVFPF